MANRLFIWTTRLVVIFGIALSPASHAQSNPIPVLIENPVKSKEMTINVRSKPFRLWQLYGTANYQMLSYVIQTGRTQKLIVIDGGISLDARILQRFIQMRNVNGSFSVHAWFITHQHMDHFGALNAILNSGKYQRGQIGEIYGSFLPVRSIQDIPNEAAHAKTAQALDEAIDRWEIPHNVDLQPGNIIWIDGVKIEILGGRNPELSSPVEGNFVNDSSLVFRVSDGVRSVLFTGDLGRMGARKLLNGPYKSRLPSDYVQMAHHGHTGASEEFYQQVNARYCLWPTTALVYDKAVAPGPLDEYTAVKTRATVESETLCGPPESGRHFRSFKVLNRNPPTYFAEIVPLPETRAP
jgi:beta-lactamase superfamily II metal-dependent hydrolase